MIVLSSIAYCAQTVNQVADNVVVQLYAGRDMILNLAFVAGLGFMVAAFFKFKQHKDNPTQVPIGNPLTYLLIGVLLLYVGAFKSPLGETLFGSGAIAGNVDV
jgi:cytochrome c oxidase assembly factor CtaG